MDFHNSLNKNVAEHPLHRQKDQCPFYVDHFDAKTIQKPWTIQNLVKMKGTTTFCQGVVVDDVCQIICSKKWAIRARRRNLFSTKYVIRKRYSAQNFLLHVLHRVFFSKTIWNKWPCYFMFDCSSSSQCAKLLLSSWGGATNNHVNMSQGFWQTPLLTYSAFFLARTYSTVGTQQLVGRPAFFAGK